jgi:OHCU decarboxylase
MEQDFPPSQPEFCSCEEQSHEFSQGDATTMILEHNAGGCGYAEQGLLRLNAADDRSAERDFMRCCSSTQWVRQMSQERPFRSAQELLDAADRVWSCLGPDDWQEALRGHPKIGEPSSVSSQPKGTEQWSSEEQSGVQVATQRTLDVLGQLNRAYLEKFGFPFVICATGKSCQEILHQLIERLKRDWEGEFQTAGEEQRRIMQLRLRKLLSVI